MSQKQNSLARVEMLLFCNKFFCFLQQIPHLFLANFCSQMLFDLEYIMEHLEPGALKYQENDISKRRFLVAKSTTLLVMLF